MDHISCSCCKRPIYSICAEIGVQRATNNYLFCMVACGHLVCRRCLPSLRQRLRCPACRNLTHVCSLQPTFLSGVSTAAPDVSTWFALVESKGRLITAEESAVARELAGAAAAEAEQARTEAAAAEARAAAAAAAAETQVQQMRREVAKAGFGEEAGELYEAALGRMVDSGRAAPTESALQLARQVWSVTNVAERLRLLGTPATVTEDVMKWFESGIAHLVMRTTAFTSKLVIKDTANQAELATLRKQATSAETLAAAATTRATEAEAKLKEALERAERAEESCARLTAAAALTTTPTSAPTPAAPPLATLAVSRPPRRRSGGYML